MKSRRILFVRHGLTEWNHLARFQGKSDIPLSETGRQQAQRLAVRLSSWGAQAIFSSPLARASETASILGQKTVPPLDPVLLEDLSEVDFGQWEGRSVKEILLRERELFERWRSDPSLYVPPDGESFDSLIQRAESACGVLFAQAFERMVVVCHGGILRVLLSYLLSIPPSAIWKMRIENCSLTGIDLLEKSPSLAFLNDALHLYVDEETARRLPFPPQT